MDLQKICNFDPKASESWTSFPGLFSLALEPGKGALGTRLRMHVSILTSNEGYLVVSESRNKQNQSKL